MIDTSESKPTEVEEKLQYDFTTSASSIYEFTLKNKLKTLALPSCHQSNNELLIVSL